MERFYAMDLNHSAFTFRADTEQPAIEAAQGCKGYGIVLDLEDLSRIYDSREGAWINLDDPRSRFGRGGIQMLQQLAMQAA